MFSTTNLPSDRAGNPVNEESDHADRAAQFLYARRKLAEPIHLVFDSGEEVTVFSVPVNPLPKRDRTLLPGAKSARLQSDAPFTPAAGTNPSPHSTGQVHWSKAWKAEQNGTPAVTNQAHLTESKPVSPVDASAATLDRPNTIADNQNRADASECATVIESSNRTARPNPPQP
jgi:hypothetical protein